jgi:uncharacterized RDD family membrane protein YckC
MSSRLEEVERRLVAGIDAPSLRWQQTYKERAGRGALQIIWQIYDRISVIKKGGGMTRRVGALWRGLAFGIDALVFLGVQFLVWAVVEEPLAARFGVDRAEILSALIVVVLWLLYTLLEIFVAATPGKILLGLAIVQADGQKAPRSVLAFRWSAKQLPWILFLTYGLNLNPGIYWLAGFMNGIIWIGCLQMLDEDKRSWLDQWARTAVIKEAKAATDISLQASR